MTKNYYGETLVFERWFVRSIISGVVATVSIIILAWCFLIYEQEFSSQNVSNGVLRGIATIIMLSPILIGTLSFIYLICYYFLPQPKKIIDISQLFRGLGLILVGYIVSFMIVLGEKSFQFELFITLIFAYVFMLVPLLLGFIAANGFEKLKRS